MHRIVLASLLDTLSPTAKRVAAAVLIASVIAAAAASDKTHSTSHSKGIGIAHHDPTNSSAPDHGGIVDSGPFSLHPPPLAGGKSEGLVRRVLRYLTFGWIS